MKLVSSSERQSAYMYACVCVCVCAIVCFCAHIIIQTVSDTHLRMSEITSNNIFYLSLIILFSLPPSSPLTVDVNGFSHMSWSEFSAGHLGAIVPGSVLAGLSVAAIIGIAVGAAAGE